MKSCDHKAIPLSPPMLWQYQSGPLGNRSEAEIDEVKGKGEGHSLNAGGRPVFCSVHKLPSAVP